MKSFYLLMVTVSLFSLRPAQADLTQIEEEYSPSLSEQASLPSPSTREKELFLFDEEMEEFEEEILALEEELKRDAETGEVEKKAPLALPSEANSAMQDEPSLKVVESALHEGEKIESLASTSLNETEAQSETPSVASSPLDISPLTHSELLQNELHSSTADSEVSNPTPSSLLKEEKVLVVEAVPLTEDSPAILNIETDLAEKKNEVIEVNIQEAFAGSPIIYTILFVMSVFALGIWLYSLLSLQKSTGASSTFISDMKNKLNNNNLEDALSVCTRHPNLMSKMVASGIHARRHGLPIMLEAMKTEGKRASVHFWQRIGLLNDVAIIAPMLGLLGTVLGMFYAFYDINRSIESISTLFDGLGVSVGTTVAGLIVAILALILHSTVKYRLVKVLAHVENEAQNLVTLVDERTAGYRG